MSVAAYDLEAERTLLGTVMAHPETAGPALLTVQPGDWWSPRHRLVADLMTARLRDGEPIDPQLVLSDVLDRGGPLRDGAGVWVFGLYQGVLLPGNANRYAMRVRALGGLRGLSNAAVRLEQRLEMSWELGDLDDVAVLTKEMEEACRDAREAQELLAPMLPVTLDDLIVEEEHQDWLVPGLLERGERIMLTATPGNGKSELFGQFGCCMAAGAHPFTGAPLGTRSYGVRLLVVEFENSRGQVRRRYRRIGQAVDECLRRHGRGGTDWRSRVHVEVRPEGTDLLRPQEVAWLTRMVSAVAPHVVVIGPLYKLHRANINDEGAARELTGVLDDLRAQHRCALLLEHHPGYGKNEAGERDLRPRGSSLLQGWPEFGYGFRRSADDAGLRYPTAVDVVAWRGDREDRGWPGKLVRGEAGELPWSLPDRSSRQTTDVIPLDEPCLPGCRKPCCS